MNIVSSTIRGKSGKHLAAGDLPLKDLLEQSVREGVDLSGARLSGTDLRHAHLANAYLPDADLENARCSWAILKGANLREANLRRAALDGADLTGARLAGANLQEARLSRARLNEADLEGIRVNWTCRDLVAELLWQAADTQARQMLAAFVLRHTICWNDWYKLTHPDKAWALEVLAGYVQDHDGAPAALVKRRAKEQA